MTEINKWNGVGSKQGQERVENGSNRSFFYTCLDVDASSGQKCTDLRFPHVFLKPRDAEPFARDSPAAECGARAAALFAGRSARCVWRTHNCPSAWHLAIAARERWSVPRFAEVWSCRDALLSPDIFRGVDASACWSVTRSAAVRTAPTAPTAITRAITRGTAPLISHRRKLFKPHRTDHIALYHLNYNTTTQRHNHIMHAHDWFLVFLAIFVPPVAVWLKRGICSKDFLINLLLFLLGFIPGLIHALYIISKYPYQQNTIRLSDIESNNNNLTKGYGTLA